MYQYQLIQFSSSVVSNPLQHHESQHTRHPCPSPTPRVYPNPCPLDWVRDAIQPSHPPLSPSPPALNLSQHQGLFQWVSYLHQVAKVSEPQLQHQSFQWIFRINFLFNWLVWSSCSSRDSQESPPAPQFERIISLVLSLLYGPILTSVHDYWKKT